MKRNFTSQSLQINVSRDNETQTALRIESDYSRSQHKGQLYVHAADLALTVERFWKSIKTKKLKLLHVGFSEIDWYDDMTDMYTTPSIRIERGLKKARISQREHGSIPKDWTFNLTTKFADGSTVTPYTEVIKAALGSFFTPEMEKEFKKKMKPFLQKKTHYISVQSKEEGDY